MSAMILSRNVSADAVREAVLDEQGRIKVLPASEWLAFPWEEVRLFMHLYPIYVLPTRELIDALRALIAPYSNVIEIGAGTGNIGRNLGIVMTDSYLQERIDIMAYYEAHGQPTIKYPEDVLPYDANKAVRRMRPDCVLGCYVTHYSAYGPGNSWGVDFKAILCNVRRLILVGNEKTHGANPLMKVYHKEIEMPDALLTRAGSGADNKIFVWGETGSIL